MAKIQLTVYGYRCERCGHEWVPRESTKHPRVCPSCKSPYWDQPRRKVTGKGRTESTSRGRSA